jgi:hypothetical protein
MEKEILLSLIGHLTTVLVAAGGWWFAWRLQKEKKQQERQQKQLEKMADEILARIILEERSLTFIHEKLGLRQETVKRQLRDQVDAEIGWKPRMSKSETKRLIFSIRN